MATTVNALIITLQLWVCLPNERKLVYDTWNKGRIDIRPLTNGAVSYVCGYIMSDVKTPDAQYQYWGDFAPQFGLYSKGLGTMHFKKNMDKYNEFGQFNLTNNGDKIFQLNDYYRKKFGFFSPSSFDKDLKKRADKNGTTYFEQKRYEDYLAEERFIHSQRVKGIAIHNTLDNFDSRSVYVFDDYEIK